MVLLAGSDAVTVKSALAFDERTDGERDRLLAFLLPERVAGVSLAYLLVDLAGEIDLSRTVEARERPRGRLPLRRGLRLRERPRKIVDGCEIGDG